MPNPQAGGPPLGGCPRLVVQHICTYAPYLEAKSSICNLRTCHTVVTRGPLNMVHNFNTHLYTNCSFQENWCTCSGFLCNLSKTGILKYPEINISYTKLNLTINLICMKLLDFQVNFIMMFVFRSKIL
jgi:hypothetical protein